MPMKRAARDQYRVEGDKVFHNPTGAWWTAYPEQAEPSFSNRGLLGDVLENGDDFDPQDVETMALRILAERHQS